LSVPHHPVLESVGFAEGAVAALMDFNK